MTFIADPLVIYTSIFSGMAVVPIFALLCVYCLKKNKLTTKAGSDRNSHNKQNHKDANTAKIKITVSRNGSSKFVIPDLELITVIEEEDGFNRNVHEVEVILIQNMFDLFDGLFQDIVISRNYLSPFDAYRKKSIYSQELRSRSMPL